MNKFPTLYKYTTKGQIQEWTVIVEGNTFYTVIGKKGGKLIPSKPTVCFGKNKDKKNETTDEEQAYLEAKALYQKKLAKGYNEEVQQEAAYFQVMLAEDGKEVELTEEDYEQGVYVQPKLDGIRASSQNNTLTSRNGKVFVSCPHLHQEGALLDGELYNHDLKHDFNKLSSLIKKTKPTEEDLIESETKIQHWLYDMPGKGVFAERYANLRNWFKMNPDKGKYFKLVPTERVYSMQEIMNVHEYFKSIGFEGTMIRMNNAPYENKRTKQLLKYKDFKDEEFEIIGYIQGKGNRTGTIGKFIMKHDKDERANFESNVKGDFAYLTYLWEHRDEFVGKKATVKYFNRTPYKEDGTGDKPRFGYITQIDRENYE